MHKIKFELPDNSGESTKYLITLLIKEIHPSIGEIRKKLQVKHIEEQELIKIREVIALCCNQIKKCVVNLLGIFKLEYNQGIFLQESRQCHVERLEWCIDRLNTIDQHLEKRNSNLSNDNTDDSINVTTMYFVNWIDHTFEVLSKLSEVVYKNDYKENFGMCELWKSELLQILSDLHLAIDELLLSAMTLCKYCLPSDQHIVKARCQVVLRETKALMTELISGVDGDDSTIKLSPATLRLPIMPSNINVLIDVLKDVLYVLETNTNTALLALLIHCFSYSKSPIDIFKEHFSSSSRGVCDCLVKTEIDDTEDCIFVKEFDLYNERLLQIGSFAISCSSDQSRILSVRSGIASLEALDPHLVPALMMSPESYHSMLLMTSWLQEVQEIRDSVFLIVEPTAFSEKSKQMMHEKLLELVKSNCYNNSDVCVVINIGSIVYDFFEAYNKNEPTALNDYDKIKPLLIDLKKAVNECKTVSNLLASENDFMYDIKTHTNKQASNEQLLKRLKLLYTVINKLNMILHPKQNEEQLFEDDDVHVCKNETHTVYKNKNSDVDSPKKTDDIMSKSVFARTSNVRSSTQNFPLIKLTKHLKLRQCEELSFSVELDNLLNGSKPKAGRDETFNLNKNLQRVRERSVLYNFSPIKNRSSLRKAVLNRHCKSQEKILERKLDDARSITDKDIDVTEENFTLQLTDVLNEMNDMTSIVSNTKAGFPSTESRTNKANCSNKSNQNTISKYVWNISTSSRAFQCCDETAVSCSSNISQPSNVTTLERINDLDFIDIKLNNLKTEFETSV